MIEFKNVSKIYPNGTVALNNVTFKINRGEFVFVVGSSGAGKSTLLKTIIREEVPSKGSVMINNFDLNSIEKKEIPYFRRTMGIVFQDFRLIPNMSIYDNVAFAMRVIGAHENEIRKRVPYVLSLVGLSNKAREIPENISGGEQQRVALARALVNNANVIIADEPTGNIDPEMSYDIVNLLDRINENGTTVIMVTHEHELVKKFNHRLICLCDGKIISDSEEGSSYENIVYKKDTADDEERLKMMESYVKTPTTTIDMRNSRIQTRPPITRQVFNFEQSEKDMSSIKDEALPKEKTSEIDYSKYLEPLNDVNLGGAD